MKGIASKIGTGINVVVRAVVLLAFLFVGLKSCVVTVWISPDTPTTYAVYGSDGRSLAMIFLPENETILLYTDDEAEYMEAVLTRMRGTYGTHYFWRLWNIEELDIGGLMGFRIYPDGAEPVVMETIVLKKFVHGTSKQALSNEGDRSDAVILFSENAVRFQDMWLEKKPTNPEILQALLSSLKAQ